MKYAKFLICVLAGLFFLPGVLAYDIWGTVVHHGTVNGISGVYVSYESVVSDNFTSSPPLSYWRMDESSGNTIIDSTGNNDGTKYGGARVSGYSGNAIKFDGVDDYIDLGNPSDLIFTDNRFTFSAWVKANQSDYWSSNSIISSGLGDVGSSATPEVFELDGTFYLISGELSGGFYGYNWTGSTWQSDTAIASGLGDVGDGSSPSVFYDGSSTYYLISGSVAGTFSGYKWTGSTWQSDASVVLGLPGVGSYSNPEVFYMASGGGGIRYLISGENSGSWNGFKWNGSGWESYPSIVSGLIVDGGSSRPSFFNNGLGDFLISGSGDGFFAGYNWTGSTWQNDTVIKSGLVDSASRSTPSVFYLYSGLYLVTQSVSGNFAGFTASQVIYSTGINGSGGFEVSFDAASVRVYISDGSDSNFVYNKDFTDGNWHHIAYVRGTYDDTSNDTFVFYVDGDYVHGHFDTYIDSIDTSNNVYIGASSVGIPRYFNGTIDSVRIYDYALTGSEISDLYAAGESVYSSGNTYTSSTGYFSFTGLYSGDYIVNFSKEGYYSKSFTATLPPSVEGVVVDFETDYNGSYPGGTPGTIIVYIVDSNGFQVEGEECSALLVGNGTVVNSQNASVHVFSGLDDSLTYDVSAGCVGYSLQNYYNVSTGSVITVYLNIGDEYIVNFNVHDLDGVPYHNTKVDLTGSFFSYGCYTDTYGRCSFTVFGDYYSVKLSGSDHNVYSDVVNVDRDRVGADEFSYALKRLDDTTGLSDEEIKGRMRQDLVFLWTIAVFAVMMFFFRSMGGQK